MKYRKAVGLSLVETVLLLLMVGLVLTFALPSSGAARRTARRMQSITQLRGIHQGMVTFAQGNKEFFPGLNAKGEILEDTAEDTGHSGDGDYVQARYWLLLSEFFFEPDFIISPSETAWVWEYDAEEEDFQAPVQWGEDVKHYSYAMLSINGEAGEAPTYHRGVEWSAQRFNSQAIVLSDRNTGIDAEDGVQSIHVSRPGAWEGSVLWNDNHVEFAQTHLFETQYGEGALNVEEDFWIPTDNLFSHDTPADPEEPSAGADALMPVYGDAGVHGWE